MKDLIQRKNDHLDIVLNPTAQVKKCSTGFERWRFDHCAMPEMCLDDIDLRSSLFGKTLNAPLLIGSMTGGASRAAAINRHLAEAAQLLGLAMGVGSQRVALESDINSGLTRELRQFAPDIVLLANLGAAQIASRKGLDYARRAVDMIDADALIIHLNPLQEALQRNGDRDWCGVLNAIERTVKALPVPIIIKEVGAGLSVPVARQLMQAGVAMLDVAGAGGTSWAAVEGERAKTLHDRAVAMAFSDWGIPTAQALLALHQALPQAQLIASGGIADGIDVAKALRLGASLVSQAAGVLTSATSSVESVVEHFQIIIDQLRIACFCTGSGSVEQLRQATMVHV
ncbi:type 2 isopentenyl-diphosphate Delta-isomerase [Superficieibacter electus]|uniref:Isopentenyl-diphosphate delta-isomerase n=1 Tax=Superficieibacter electus TaxID=2022662 RepID=A0A2P5GS58_9ENTR|nr:type 2 isopentenyl-diphosphate Delta-isomerase [Superficieibacter electus]POP46672.1 type 2 isopentenyl-diphosphate Delta-isomerase [Superficieibacter electus]POP49410.1 type 2 isopentenyl-diphosphate Delta-isomerase [Superficieibacter electus]